MRDSINRLIQRADSFGQLVDIRCGTSIVQIAPQLTPMPGESVFDACGGAVMPGLHDHHLHLMATAALATSVNCAPTQVSDAGELAALLNETPGQGWLRGVGYHESTAGVLDRLTLDTLCTSRPVRIQHRSGKLWILNSLACEQLMVQAHTHLPGVDTYADGTPSGRLFRLDDWLRQQLSSNGLPDLVHLSEQLYRFGITGVTDASVTNSDQTMLLHAKIGQDIHWMGGAELTAGHRKIILDEDALPSLDALTHTMAQAHDDGRAVAVHCVAHIELLLALTALQQAGGIAGDRIEHAAVVHPDMLSMLGDSGAAVVTQPGFIWQRGDQYRKDVDAPDWPYLYRYQSLLQRGIRTTASSDAPYGPLNPWQVMHAATQRLTRDGHALGEDEWVTSEQALDGYLSPPLDPGGVARQLTEGSDATLIVLDRPWSQARAQLDQVQVQMTLHRGQLVHSQ